MTDVHFVPAGPAQLCATHCPFARVPRQWPACPGLGLLGEGLLSAWPVPALRFPSSSPFVIC